MIKSILKTLFISLVFFLILQDIFGQTIQVVDAKTGKPVVGVLLITDGYTIQTDDSGFVILDKLDSTQTIIFKHSSYLKKTTTKQKIIRQGKIVMLVEDPVRLEEIIVSANRWEQSKTEIPNNIRTIQATEIYRQNPQTTADILDSKSGVFIQKSQMGGGSPMIRGFAANRVLIVVDGIRMNNAIYRSGNLHNVISIDPQSLENAEVIFGPGSVIYGSDALGGVMSFNTLKPALSTSNKKEQFGKLFSRYSSANFEKTISGSYNIGSKKWAVVINSTYTDYNDLKMGSHGPDEYLRSEYVLKSKFSGTDKIIQNNEPQIQKYSSYNQFNLLSKIRYRPNDNLEFIVSGLHSQTSIIPRYDRLILYRNDKLRYGEWYYGPQKWTMFSGQLQYTKKRTLFDKLSLLIGYQNYEESRNDRNLDNPILRQRTENSSALSVNIDFGKSFNKQNELYYGLETFINKVNSDGTARNLIFGETEAISSRYPDGSHYNSFAAYYSYKFILNEKFIFQTGSRLTVTLLDGDFNSDFYSFPFNDFDMGNSAFNGSMGIVWHPTPEWQINVNASSGFRSPNIDDVAKVFDSEPGNVIVPNPKLKPEYAQNFEIQSIRSYSNKAKIELTAFYTRLKDAMVRRNFSFNGRDSIIYDGVLSNVEALVNAESAYIFGGSFSFEYLFTNFIRTRNEVSILKGKDSDNYPMRHVPPTFGSSHLIFENQEIYMDLCVRYNGIFDYEDLAPSEQDKPHIYAIDENGRPYAPGWWTLNLKSTWKINNKYSLGAGVENIFDKRYRPYSSGISAHGINAIVSFQVEL